MASQKEVENYTYKIAELYYLDNKSQVEIAKELNLSRPTVSRLLKRAQNAGIVQITLSHPEMPYLHLSEKIKEKFSLENVFIVEHDSVNEEPAIDRAAAAVGQHLLSSLRPGDRIGISDGRINLRIPEFIAPRAGFLSLSILPLQGSFVYTGDPAQNNNLIIMELAKKLGAKPYFMPAAFLYESADTRRAIEREPYVKRIFTEYRNLTKAIISIGDGTFQKLKQRNIFTIDEMIPEESVCNIGAQFFDISGRPLPCSYGDHLLGIKAEDLRCIPDVIAATVGDEKKVAALAALRAGFITTLITDDAVAAFLLQA